MDEIKAWLTGAKNYDAGVLLYLRHGKDPLLRKVFAEPASDFKKKKLETALRELLQVKKAKAVEMVASKETLLQKDIVAATGWPTEKDDVLTALHLQWKPLFSEMNALCAQIYEVALQGEKDPGKQAEAGRMAHRIIDLDDQCDKIYAQREYYLQYGKLPDEAAPAKLVVDSKKLYLAFENSKKYVRQYKAKLVKHPENVNFAKQLKKYEEMVEIYKKELGYA